MASTANRARVGRVGHDTGRLVLQLERLVAVPTAQVQEALKGSGRGRGTGLSGCDSAGPGFERWDVDAASSGSRVSFTAWIDAEDVEAAAWTGATYHECCERVVRALAPVTDGAEVADVDSEQLTMAYLSAFAAALADTD